TGSAETDLSRLQNNRLMSQFGQMQCSARSGIPRTNNGYIGRDGFFQWLCIRRFGGCSIPKRRFQWKCVMRKHQVIPVLAQNVSKCDISVLPNGQVNKTFPAFAVCCARNTFPMNSWLFSSL